MSDQNPQSKVPLKLSIVFDMLEPPHRAPDGTFSDNALAAECYPGGRGPGWYASIADELQPVQDPAPHILLLAARDRGDAGHVRRLRCQARPTEGNFGADSTEAKNAEAILNRYKKMARGSKVPVHGDTVCFPGPREAGRLQVVRRRQGADMLVANRGLEVAFGKNLSRDYFYPPGLNCNSGMIKKLSGELGHFLILAPDFSSATEPAAGSQGCHPRFTGRDRGRKGSQVIALFADGRAEKLVQRLAGEQRRAPCRPGLPERTHQPLPGKADDAARLRFCVAELVEAVTPRCAGDPEGAFGRALDSELHRGREPFRRAPHQGPRTRNTGQRYSGSAYFKQVKRARDRVYRATRTRVPH